MVTMQDVANRAGVSLKTVSNVVNGFPSIRESTRARVQAALVELGYRPNMAARSLAGGRTGLVAVMIPDVDSSYFGRLGGALMRQASALDLTAVIQQTGGTVPGELATLNNLQRHFVDGMVGTSLALTDEELIERVGRLPVVMLGERWGGEPLLDHISIDTRGAGAAAVAHLIEQGRRRIGLIGLRNIGFGPTDSRLQGAQQVLADHGLEPVIAEVGPYDREHGYDAMASMLGAGRNPDGVFCFNDELAVGALAALHDAGITCPDDVALIGFDDTREGRYASPGLSSVRYDPDELAITALQRLKVAMQPPAVRDEPGDYVIPHSIVVRESTVRGAGRGPCATGAVPEDATAEERHDAQTL